MSEIKLQDYAHYYIGCRCLNTWFTPDHDAYNANWKLTGFESTSIKPYLLENDTDNTFTDSIKPILRKLEDITDEEIRELINYDKWDAIYGGIKYTKTKSGIDIDYAIDAGDDGCYPQSHHVSFILLTPQQVVFFTKKGFDMFNLINAGLAIDSKKI